MSVRDLPAQDWLPRARRVYRFMDRPIGNLSRQAKVCLGVYTVLLLLTLWGVA